MLPTKEKAVKENQLVLSPSSNYLFKSWADAKDTKDYIGQHLYILSDEKIKEGDWYYDPFDSKIRKALSNIDSHSIFSNCKKIIATTDDTLTFKDDFYIRYLPTIPDNFIDKFIAMYNTNPIKDAMVEYDEIGEAASEYKLKVDENNQIAISTTKETWTKDEVIKLCSRAYQLGSNSGYLSAANPEQEIDQNEEFQKWTDQNI